MTILSISRYLEAAPVMDANTYAVLLDDVSAGDGIYDYCISTYGSSESARLYKWSAADGCDNNNVKTLGGGCFNFDTTNNVVQFAVPIADAFTPVSTDKAYAITHGGDNDAFEEGGSWEGTNAPTVGAGDGDYTEPCTIPEFGEVFLPVCGVVGCLWF